MLARLYRKEQKRIAAGRADPRPIQSNSCSHIIKRSEFLILDDIDQRLTGFDLRSCRLAGIHFDRELDIRRSTCRSMRNHVRVLSHSRDYEKDRYQGGLHESTSAWRNRTNTAAKS